MTQASSEGAVTATPAEIARREILSNDDQFGLEVRSGLGAGAPVLMAREMLWHP
jgi:hypothetical protein